MSDTKTTAKTPTGDSVTDDGRINWIALLGALAVQFEERPGTWNRRQVIGWHSPTLDARAIRNALTRAGTRLIQVEQVGELMDDPAEIAENPWVPMRYKIALRFGEETDLLQARDLRERARDYAGDVNLRSEHGLYRYRKHGCRCLTCKTANAEHNEAQRARRLAELQADPGDPVHGTTTGYSYGCRCDECKAAKAAKAASDYADSRDLDKIREKVQVEIADDWDAEDAEKAAAEEREEAAYREKIAAELAEIEGRNEAAKRVISEPEDTDPDGWGTPAPEPVSPAPAPDPEPNLLEGLGDIFGFGELKNDPKKFGVYGRNADGSMADL